MRADMAPARLARTRWIWVFLLAGQLAACTCQRGEPPALPSEAAPLPREDAAPSPRALEVPKLSAPIGAALLADGAVVVAGLSVRDRAVRVARIEKDDRVAWITDTFAGAEWAHDSEIGVHAVDTGVVVTFRGRLEGGIARSLVRLDRAGALQPGKVALGPVTCATRHGFYWLEGRKAAHAELGEGPKVFALPSGGEGEPSLFCDPTHATLVLDADGALSIAELGATSFGPVFPLVVEKDFADEEREHALFTGPRERGGMGVFRVGTEGGLSLKLPGGAPRKLAAKLHEDDDLLLVDADDRTLYAVSTQDREGCAAGEDASALPTERTSRFSTSVHLLRVDLESGQTSREELGRSACGHQPGPFFLGTARGKKVIGWTERAPSHSRDGKKRKAPIAALSYRVFGATSAGTVAARKVVSADALVDAGCIESGCAAAWLERPEGQDDREPEVVRVLRYPD